jgi:hypothetical protein
MILAGINREKTIPKTKLNEVSAVISLFSGAKIFLSLLVEYACVEKSNTLLQKLQILRHSLITFCNENKYLIDEFFLVHT